MDLCFQIVLQLGILLVRLFLLHGHGSGSAHMGGPGSVSQLPLRPTRRGSAAEQTDADAFGLRHAHAASAAWPGQSGACGEPRSSVLAEVVTHAWYASTAQVD